VWSRGRSLGIGGVVLSCIVGRKDRGICVGCWIRVSYIHCICTMCHLVSWTKAWGIVFTTTARVLRYYLYRLCLYQPCVCSSLDNYQVLIAGKPQPSSHPRGCTLPKTRKKREAWPPLTWQMQMQNAIKVCTHHPSALHDFVHVRVWERDDVSLISERKILRLYL